MYINGTFITLELTFPLISFPVKFWFLSFQMCESSATVEVKAPFIKNKAVIYCVLDLVSSLILLAYNRNNP